MFHLFLLSGFWYMVIFPQSPALSRSRSFCFFSIFSYHVVYYDSLYLLHISHHWDVLWQMYSFIKFFLLKILSPDSLYSNNIFHMLFHFEILCGKIVDHAVFEACSLEPDEMLNTSYASFFPFLSVCSPHTWSNICSLFFFWVFRTVKKIWSKFLRNI